MAELALDAGPPPEAPPSPPTQAEAPTQAKLAARTPSAPAPPADPSAESSQTAPSEQSAASKQSAEAKQSAPKKQTVPSEQPAPVVQPAQPAAVQRAEPSYSEATPAPSGSTANPDASDAPLPRPKHTKRAGDAYNAGNANNTVDANTSATPKDSERPAANAETGASIPSSNASKPTLEFAVDKMPYRGETSPVASDPLQNLAVVDRTPSIVKDHTPPKKKSAVKEEPSPEGGTKPEPASVGSTTTGSASKSVKPEQSPPRASGNTTARKGDSPDRQQKRQKRVGNQPSQRSRTPPKQQPPPPHQQQQAQPPPMRPTPSWQTAPRATHGRRGPPSAPVQMAANNAPPPRNLPKNAKHRPNNARVFVGNLASEFTNTAEMVRIFYKYGELIEEPVLRRSFGFIQYSTAEAATRAVAAEQGRVIGGIGIDLSIADNREVKRGTHVVNNTPFPHGPKQKAAQNVGRPNRRDQGPPPAAGVQPNRKRRRSLSPGAPPRRMGTVLPPTFHRSRPDPRNGFHLRVLCMSPTARQYAQRCQQLFQTETGLRAEIGHIIASGLGDALGHALRESIPYVMVVASKDVEDGTCTIRTLEKTGYEKSGRGNGVIPLREAVEVCLIDRGIKRPGPPGPPQAPVAQAGWSASRQPTGNRGMPGQPGWMSGARAPAHAQQQQTMRGPQAAMAPNMGGPPQQHAYPPAVQAQMAPHQMGGPMQGRPDPRGQFDRQPPYGGMPQQGGIPPHGGMQQQPPMGNYGAPAPQMGWNGANYQTPQQTAMGQPPVGQQDYARGAYGPPPPQSGMNVGSGGAPNGRDEYDPAAVMPGGNRGGSYSVGWNGPQQDAGYNRGGPPYDQGRPGPGQHGRDGVQGSYGMSTMQGPGAMQGGYNQYANAPGNEQGFVQRPGAYGPPAGGMPPVGGYGAPGGPGPAPGGYNARGGWGQGGSMPYDDRQQPHGMQANAGGMHANAVGMQGNAYGPVNPGQMNRNGGGDRGGDGGYGSPPNAEWGGRGNGPQNGGRPGYNGGQAGYNGGQPGMNRRNGSPAYNAPAPGGGEGNSAPGTGGVDIGKLSSLISAFQNQQPAAGGDGQNQGGQGGVQGAQGQHGQHGQQGGQGQQYYGQYGGSPGQGQGFQQQQGGQQQRGSYYGR